MRFVIHEHLHLNDPMHWDLMLEWRNVLKTFRLNCAPQDLSTQPCLVTPIFDHDVRFLTYEGPVQQGQGLVKCVILGTYESMRRTDETWTVALKGDQLQTCIKLPLKQQEPLIIVNI